MFFFGGEVINNFAFALVVGVLIGTYSSVAVAAPMVLIYSNYRERSKAALVAAKAVRAK
jgi:preprotein translocase subunit SecF